MMGNVILAGDLHIILNQDEKRGGSVVRDPIKEQVNDIILDWGLSYIIPGVFPFGWNDV